MCQVSNICTTDRREKERDEMNEWKNRRKSVSSSQTRHMFHINFWLVELRNDFRFALKTNAVAVPQHKHTYTCAGSDTVMLIMENIMESDGIHFTK